MPEPDVGECIKQYRLLRDKKDAMEKEHKDATRPYTEAMDSISGHLMSLMEAQGVTSFKSEHGTAFRTDWMPFAGRRQSGYGIGGIGYTMRDMCEEKMMIFSG